MPTPDASPQPATMSTTPAAPAPPAATSNRPAERSRYESLKTNVSYLAYGSAAGTAAAPASLKTRTLLRTTRYVLRYVFTRLVRYAKYAIIGSIGAALGGSLLASVASGAAFFVAPSALASTGIAIGWAVLKFAYNHRPASLVNIQSRISSLLHLSPSATQTAARGTADERAVRASA